MEIAEIVDQESLKDYLNDLPSEIRNRSAHFVAMRWGARVVPMATEFTTANSPAVSGRLSPLPIFGALISTCTAFYTGTWADGAETDIAEASALAARDADAPRAASAGAAIVSASIAAYAATGSNPAFSDAIVASIVSVHASEDSLFRLMDKRLAIKPHPLSIFWSLLGRDLMQVAKLENAALWNGFEVPQQILTDWSATCNALIIDKTDWRFWIAFYNRLLDGKDIQADLLAPILSKLTKEDWLGDPALVTPLFDDVLAVYEAEDAANTPQSPVDFSFDDLVNVMRMIGIDDNMRHLKAPEVVQSFLDDAQEVRDGFVDFVDDAKEMQGGNFVGILRKRAETILAEFQHTQDLIHLRAERIVMLAQELELYSKDSKAASDLGDTLYTVLQNRLVQLKRLCRQHFGPSYVSLAPLAQLRLEQIEQDEVIRILDEALNHMTALPNADHYALDAEGSAVLADMLRELQDTRAAIANADDDEFVAILQARFAENSGALGLSISKFYERSAEAMQTTGRHADIAMKMNKRIQGLDSILDAVKDFIGGGGV